MKKIILPLVCLLIITLCSCAKNPTIEIIQSTEKPPETEAVQPKTTPEAEPEPAANTEEEQDGPITDEETPPDEAALATPTPEQTPIGMSPDPPSGPAMYSSYAHMVSYDPARGWADFDYFEMLTGDDAVQWKVEHEGYTLADAQAEVADWGDGEFTEKNTNTQLRTIDLKDVPISLQFEADGTQVIEGVDSTVADVFALYNLDADLYLYDYFFYIHVDSDGNVTLVEQVYWC